LPARAIDLFRDDHADRSYRFESDAKEVTATISEADAIPEANKWAARFYNDPFIQFESIEFKTAPTRFWLVTFRHSDTGKTFYTMVMPDGAIFEPRLSEGT
jgi:hypothetical protein